MKYFAIIYAAGFIVTFGAAWNHNPATERGAIADADDINMLGSLGCAAAWPLYWSYRAFAPR